MSSSSRLLDRVCYLSRAPSKDKDLFGNEITVKHTFPYNPDSKTAPETAQRWAEDRTYDYKTHTYLKGTEPEFLERPNYPFNITIINLDVRSQGGRAYKVIDSQNRCFDLREDQVLEVFKHTGILAGGAVPGQFVWGVLGSTMRMVLVDGDLHKEMVAGAEELNAYKRDQALGKTPTEATLQFGHVYRKRDKSEHVFLGRVKVPGNEKTLFAFAELPNPPPIVHGPWEDDDLDDDDSRYNKEHLAHMREECDIAKRWPQMTWPERAQWDQCDRSAYLYRMYPEVEPGYYNHYINIVLMSSPKFEAEVETHESILELAQQMRENAGAKHMYVNGHGDDIAERRWEEQHNSGHQRKWTPDWNYHRDYKTSHEDRKRAESAYRIIAMKEYNEIRAQFQKELTWTSQ